MVKLGMTIGAQLIHNGYIDKIKNHEFFVIKSADLPDVPWDDILDILNSDILENRITEKKWLNEYGFRIVDVDRITKALPIMDEIETIFEPSTRHPGFPRKGYELYVSLTTQERSYGGRIHDDVESVLYWGLQGISSWTIFDENDNEIFSVDIGPKDIIFCPSGTRHKVIVKKPRAALSFGFDRLREQF